MDVLSGLAQRSGAFRCGPWIMRQRWHNLLFAHWPVEHSVLRAAVPPKLSVDTFDGQAWLGMVVFQLSSVRLRGLPQIAPVASFAEVNVRTYVTYNDRPGVYFMSLDADNPLAVALARPWFRLNYYNSEISLRVSGDGEDGESGMQFKSRRIERGAPEARLEVTYARLPSLGDYCPTLLERWLTERYCYYAVRNHRVLRCDIEHGRWPLQPARAAFAENSMAEAHGIKLPACTPLLHYVPFMEARIWPLRNVECRVASATYGAPGRKYIARS